PYLDHYILGKADTGQRQPTWGLSLLGLNQPPSSYYRLSSPEYFATINLNFYYRQQAASLER
ncbi:MAG: hypothetical protein KBH36_04880, partial [Acidaminococcaceae bacterium]|nr:hypothetical protein [Acidaminococcaceae bacterium]